MCWKSVYYIMCIDSTMLQQNYKVIKKLWLIVSLSYDLFHDPAYLCMCVTILVNSAVFSHSVQVSGNAM